jgi:diguanylate cyclase (GGDEF)-like protein
MAASLLSWRNGFTAALAIAICVGALVFSGATRNADNWFYDMVVGHGVDAASDRIVVIAVDDKSLSALGRWPWPRRIHADLLDRLREAQPKGIGFDVMFSEPDYSDPDGDRALAIALKRSGPVVLPVMVEPLEPGGTPVEVLPMRAMAQAAAGLGHTVVDTDADGVSRSAYLRAGLGDPHWPAFALALFESQADATGNSVPGVHNPRQETASPYLWTQDDRVLVPYAPSREFQQISYIDVMRGQVPASLLRNRWLLVGVTARGVGDSVPTPLRAGDERMPGVIYQANLLNMLLQGDAIAPVANAWRLPLAFAMVLLPALLLLHHRSRRAWWIIPLAVLLILATSAALLYFAHAWLPPMAPVFALLLVFVLVAAYGMRQSDRLAHSDALTQLANRRLFDLILKREFLATKRNEKPLSLLLIDVDHFKHYNDTCGHQAGDELLRTLAQAVERHVCRPRDLPARYGGDELAAILPETAAHMAHRIAEAIVRDVRALAIPRPGTGDAQIVTVSIGVAASDPRREHDSSMLLERADVALYQAKRLGRNRSYLAADWDA